MGDTAGRPLLPQGNLVNENSFGSFENTGQKNYVFVDEHNRQRRLKVMRACEACRRRKIKCDAVTTNKWPCQRCQRSQLDCVPPPSDGSGFDFDTDYKDSSLVSPMTGPGQNQNVPWQRSQMDQADFSAFQDNMYFPPQQPPAPMRAQSFDVSAMPAYQLARNPMDDAFNQADSYSGYPKIRHGSADATSEPGQVARQDTPSEAELAEAMGNLTVNSVAVAGYMTNQKQLAQTPAIEEDEISIPLPKQNAGSHTVSIPEEMMPTNEKAKQYFDFYFANVHPYVPVLIPRNILKHWEADKWSMSPLVLEGIFACASQMLGEKEEFQRWLALATRHQESFKDTPRLSTIQGLLILMKAREGAPQRGYYYRSWMNLVNLVAMAKDLEFDQHYETHQAGESCHASGAECAIKTRIWHLLYQLEVMIGGPQGRYDFSVKGDTIDFSAPSMPYGIDESEMTIFNDQTQLAKNIRNIRESSRIYYTLRKKRDDWASDPEFLANDRMFEKWLEEIPERLRITYPSDGSPPFIPFHVAANIHSYYWLGVVMHHRPQLELATKTNDQDAIDRQMKICWNAATKLCRLHEAILSKYGLTGLACMQRGVSMTIYTVLTCTMLHLVALTSPNPEINNDAQRYFVRHMQVLEKCADAWPMPEMKAQIDSLRQAFSADMSKPFELKANFPYGSPGPQRYSNPSTPSDGGSLPYEQTSSTASAGSNFYSGGISSARNGSVTSDSVYGSMADSTSNMPPFTQADAVQFNWNPSRLMSSWDAAFNPVPQGSTSPPSIQQQRQQQMDQNSYAMSQPNFTQDQTDFDFTGYNNTSASNYSSSYTSQDTQMPAQDFMPQQQQAQVYQPPVTQAQNFFTPNMWQETVASTFGDTLKRRYGDGPGYVRTNKKPLR